VPRNFQHWLKAYCEFTATSEAPLDFHFWTGISTIAAVLRRRVWKDELLFKWTPNFYIIFVGPAGVVTKSTTLNIGYKLLEKVPGINFGPDSMTWHGLGKRFEESVEYAVMNAGTAHEAKILMSPLTCSISELGTFLKPDDHALISFLTDVWDGKERPFAHDTGYSGKIRVENPWLNVIGATTPEWLQDNFPASMLQQGIGSRIIFVYGDTKRHLTAYPSRAQKSRPLNYKDTEDKLIQDLVAISKLIGPYELTDDAYLWGEAWYAKHNTGRSTQLASSRYSGYFARKQTHLHKLAMILSAAQRDALLIEREDLENASKILESTEHSMIKVFESVGVVDEAKHIAELVAFVRTYKWISVGQLYRLCFNIMSERDFKQAVRVSVEGGLLQVEQRGNERGLAPRTGTIH
jgi:Protein of unknown function (DUF3987)